MSEQISYYNQLSATPTNAMGVRTDTIGAQYIDSGSALIGKVISRIDARLEDYNWSTYPATGNVWLEIIHSGATQATSNTVSASSLGNGTYTTHTFTFSGNNYVMQSGDSIWFLFDWGGPINNEMIGIAIRTPSTESNTHAASWTPSDGWLHYSNTYDMCINIYEITGTTQKQVGIAKTITSTEAYANQYDALVSAPTTFFDRLSNDCVMQVYINDQTGVPNHLYTTLHNSTSKFAGVYINSSSAGLYGKKVTRCAFRIKKTGSPTGTLYCRLKKASDGSTITFGLNGTPGLGKDVSTLTTASTPADLFSFENDDNGQTSGYACQSGDRIYLELSGGTSSAGTQVDVARTHTTSRIANVEMQVSTNGTTWTPSDATGANDDDMIGTIYVGGYQPPSVFPYHQLGYINSRVAQKVTSSTVSEGNIYNQKITQIKPYLKAIGSPTGLINAVIRNSSDTLVANINTYDASSVSTSTFTQYTFTNLNQSYTMGLNDRICLEYSGGDVNNHIQVNTNLLDTYPYGTLETYAGSSYTTQTLHDMAGDMFSGGGATDPLARTRVGEKVATTSSAIKLKTISRVTIYLKRTVSPTGNVYIRIRNAADAIVATIGQITASSIDPNTPTAYQVTSDPISLYALQVGDHVSVEYNAGDDFNYVQVMTTKTTDGFDGTTNTYLSKYDDIAWVPNNAIDLVGQMWEGGETYTPSQEDVVIPDPNYTKDLTVLAGGTPWSWVNHDLLTIDFAPSQRFVNAVMPDFRFYRKILTSTELTNIFTNRLDRATIALGQVSRFAYSYISET